jgi:hypothetical protein
VTTEQHNETSETEPHRITVPISETLVSILKEHLGEDENLWQEFLEGYLRYTEETIEYALDYEDQREPEWDAAEAAWPIFF